MFRVLAFQHARERQRRCAAARCAVAASALVPMDVPVPSGASNQAPVAPPGQVLIHRRRTRKPSTSTFQRQRELRMKVLQSKAGLAQPSFPGVEIGAQHAGSSDVSAAPVARSLGATIRCVCGLSKKYVPRCVLVTRGDRAAQS